MNHPYDLLADLVDGTLDEGNLAGVQAHLGVCATCRDDVAHATAGGEAARSLPQVAAPPDLHQRVVFAAGGRGRGTPSWYRWAGVAAAAAVVVAIAIALPNVGSGGNDRAGEETMAAADAQGSAAAGASTENVETSVEDTNYTEVALQRLASASRSDALSGEEAAPTATIADPAAAVRCVERASRNGTTGRLTRLIEARFEGRAAYIAVYLEGPRVDLPDLATVWVAATDDCSFLSLAYAKL